MITTAAATSALTACGQIDMGTRSDRRPAEGGIGGTGIVGLVTEFGSLIINGIKVATSRTTSYSDATGRISEDQIRLRDALTVEAETRSGRLIARRVHVNHPLIGQVQTVTRNGAELRVNGVTVMVEQQARGQAQPGARVKVSGLWSGNRVIASAITATDLSQDVVSGEATRHGTTTFLNGVMIQPETLRKGIAVGQFATVMGRYAYGRIYADDVTLNRFTGAAGALKRLSVEGYLDPADTAPGFKISGFGHSFAERLQLDRFAASRALFEGPYTGKFEANRGLILPDSYARRRTTLGNRVDDVTSGNWLVIT